MHGEGDDRGGAILVKEQVAGHRGTHGIPKHVPHLVSPELLPTSLLVLLPAVPAQLIQCVPYSYYWPTLQSAIAHSLALLSQRDD